MPGAGPAPINLATNLSSRLTCRTCTAAVLDDDALPAISQASRVYSENGDHNLHQEITPVVPTHMPSPDTPPHHHYQGCVCVFVCFCNGFLFRFFILYKPPFYLIRTDLQVLYYTVFFPLLYTDTASAPAIYRILLCAPSCLCNHFYTVLPSA